MFDYDAFMHDANTQFLVHEGNLRYGQFLMNFLHEKHSEIYARIPSDIDCYYDNSKCSELMIFLSNLKCANL